MSVIAEILHAEGRSRQAIIAFAVCERKGKPHAQGRASFLQQVGSNSLARGRAHLTQLLDFSKHIAGTVS